ncbi:MAG: exodeoxyribonuclease V subunit gamma, partial [Gemmatimonadaceae bacterium]
MKLYRSQQANVLAGALADLLATPVGTPFESELVVVSGGAAEQLLRLTIAQRLGVCANVTFLSPSKLLEQTLAAVLGEQREVVDAWSAQRLTWAVASLLPSHLTDKRFSQVRFYLGSSSPGSARLMGLARRIGESFARYIDARPEMIARWEVAAAKNDGWQPVLWRAISERIGTPHLAKLWGTAVDMMNAGQAPAGSLPKRLTWLAHPRIAPLHLDVFAALSRAGVDAHLFALVPSREGARRAVEASLAHLDDVAPHPLEIPDYGNPLLESLARHSRDFELLVTRASHQQRDETDLFVEPAGHTMLATLQRDVMDGVRRGVAGVKPVAISSTFPPA